MKVSVVIATHRRTAQLALVLETLTLQTEKDFEVHVVNDAGDPATAALVESFRDRLKIEHYWSGPEGGTPLGAATTRNVGVRLSSAPRLLIVDDDCLCPSDVVAAHAAYGQQPVGVIGFRRHVRRPVQEKLTLEHLKDIKKLVHGEPELRARPDQLKNLQRYVATGAWAVQFYCWTCHISYPTHIVKYVGGFWEEMRGSGAEDCELGLRCWRAGVRYKVLYDPSVYHLDHSQSPLQQENIQRNRELFYQTRDQRNVVVRNGGPIR